CLLFQLFIDWRRFIRLSIIFAFLIAAPIVFLQIATGGGFLLNLVVYNVNELKLSYFIYDVGLFINQYVLLLAIALPVILYTIMSSWNFRDRSSEWWRTKLRKCKFRRALIILTLHGFVAAATLVSMAKVGGGLNYALVLQLTLLILSGVF